MAKTRNFKDLPARCPICDARKLRHDDVIGLAVVRYACGMVLTKTGAEEAEWRTKTDCPDANDQVLEIKAALVQIVAQLRLCGYECEGGNLENNVEFVRLVALAERGRDPQAAPGDAAGQDL